jgi:hypothetical protein
VNTTILRTRNPRSASTPGHPRDMGPELRRSSALKDLLAECALWTTPWTPPYQDPDCAEEFALCAAVWRDVPYYDDSGGAQALPSSISARRQPRRRREGS